MRKWSIENSEALSSVQKEFDELIEEFSSYEEFTNFFTERKPIVEEQGSSNTANQHEQPRQSVSADKDSNLLGNNKEVRKRA